MENRKVFYIKKFYLKKKNYTANKIMLVFNKVNRCIEIEIEYQDESWKLAIKDTSDMKTKIDIQQGSFFICYKKLLIFHKSHLCVNQDWKYRGNIKDSNIKLFVKKYENEQKQTDYQE